MSVESEKPRLRNGKIVGIVILVLLGLASAFVYLGAYNVAGDEPHLKPVAGLIEAVRDRSISVRSAGVTVPADLERPERIAAGAGLYAEMCSQCHLGPGVERTEISQGLYPAAPDLARDAELGPKGQFWVIKHGIKMTAMPAWGKTHDDELIWNMVAFLKKLPSMSPQAYRTAIASAPADHDEMMETMGGERSGHDDGHQHDEATNHQQGEVK